MKYLITGGAGFLGWEYIRYNLMRHDDNLYVCYDLMKGAPNEKIIKNVYSRYNNLIVIRGSVNDKAKLKRVFRRFRFDYVINFAEESHINENIKSAKKCIKTNVLAVKTLMDLCLKFKVKRFHQVSTGKVYGQTPIDSNVKFSEDSPLKPLSTYASSKACADMLVLNYAKIYNIDATISRSSTNFGTYHSDNYFIPKVVCDLKRGNEVVLKDDINDVRDWMYVHDYVKAIDLIILKGEKGEVYNISTHNEISKKDIVKKIYTVLDRDYSSVKFENENQESTEINNRYALDSSKIEELGFSSSFDFNSCFTDIVIKYYLSY